MSPLTYLDFGTLQWGAGEHGDGLALAENVVPAYGLKRPLERPHRNGSNSVASVTLNSTYAHVYPKNSGAASYVGDEITEFHGSKTEIYVYDRTANTWTSVASGLGGAGEPPAGRFASYGNDVWYTNRTDDLQVRTNNTGSFGSGVGGSVFKPKPRFLAVVKNYMMGFDLNNATYYSDSYAWSVPGNPAVWDASASGGGGTGRIVSRPGQIMGVIGGELARVFKRSSMHSLQFTGDVVGTNGGTWREDLISETVGTPWPSSIVLGDQGYAYFLGQDSYFYRQHGASPPERISSFEIAGWLADPIFSPGAIHADIPVTMTEEDLWVQGAYNPKTGVIFWIYRALTDAGSVNPGVREKTRGIFFSTITMEFTTWEDNASWLGVQTLGGLPAAEAATETLGGIYMTAPGVGTSSRYTFSDSLTTPMRLRTRRQALSLSAQELPVTAPVRVKSVIPVASSKTLGGDPLSISCSPLPSGLSVIVHVSNDPGFKELSVGITPINPRSELADVSNNADPDYDTLPFIDSSGIWQVFELSMGAETLTIRAMPGLWIQWEMVQ